MKRKFGEIGLRHHLQDIFAGVSGGVSNRKISKKIIRQVLKQDGDTDEDEFIDPIEYR